MTRRCSHCSHNGHNARTCPSRGSGGGGSVRLFGVSLTEGVGPIKKSASMSCIDSTSGASGASGVRRGASGDHRRESGYMSDDQVHASCSSNCRTERKKGTPWTEQEHRMFLRGLQTLGKGDWRGISRNYVVTRTPTQVASHAQKYFLRQSNASHRKRRTSLFDMIPDLPLEPVVPVNQQESNHITAPFPDQSRECCFTSTPPIPPSIYASGVVPHVNPVWFSSNHEIVKPIPACADEIAPISQLQINDAVGEEQASLSLKLFDPNSSRQSAAFHASPSMSIPDLNKNSGSVIHAL